MTIYPKSFRGGSPIRRETPIDNRGTFRVRYRQRRPGPPGPRKARCPCLRHRRLAFQPRHRHAVLARTRQVLSVQPAQGRAGFRRLEAVRAFRGRMASRRPGAALGAQGAAQQADLRFRDRRHYRHPQEPRRPGRLPHRLRDVQRHSAGEVFPQRVKLAHARSVRPAASASGGRAPLPIPRRHLLLRRSRSALGRQAHQEGLDGAPEGVPGARHRPGADGAVGQPRNQVHVHDAEAARRPGDAAGEGRFEHRASRASSASSAAAPR